MSRTLGHEFMNGFNYELMASFKCNHDIQILLGGSDVADRIHYCCKYVTKQQKRLDSQVAVAVAALKRREEREMIESVISGEQDPLTVSRKRVAGMVYCMTNRQEVAGPLAALYLYRGSCCYASAACASLPIGDVIRQLMQSDDYSCNLVNASEEGDSNYRAVSFLDDYIFRPDSLDNVNMYEFTMWYFRKKKANAARTSLGFVDGNPLRSTHCLGKRYESVVPVVQGFRIPYTSNDESSPTTAKYAILSILLFKPFREMVHLIGNTDCLDEGSWMQAFHSWKQTRSPFVETIMNNMNDYYIGLKKAEAQSKAANNAQANHHHSEDSSSENIDDVYDGGASIDFDEGVDKKNEIFLSMWEENSGNIVLDSLSIDPADCPTSVAPDNRVARMINVFESHGIIGSFSEKLISSRNVGNPTNAPPPVTFMKAWVQDAKTDNKLIATASSAPVSRGRERL